MSPVVSLGSKYPPDCAEQYYHSSGRITLELLFCLAILVAYLPQYITIWRASSVTGISSYYVLYHALFSTAALCIRIANDLYYDTFNCVNNGTLSGWQTISALTGYFQVAVQWACAIVLLVLFLRRYDWDLHRETEPNAMSPGTIKKTMSSFAIVLVPISLFFLWHNDDAWTKPAMSWGFVVYIMMLGFFMFFLKLGVTLGFGLAQFGYQIRLLRSMRSRGALSIVSLGLLSIAFITLAVLQLLRSRPNLHLDWRTEVDRASQVSYYYSQLSLNLGYLIAGVGNLILFVLCCYYECRDNLGRQAGSVHLK